MAQVFRIGNEIKSIKLDKIIANTHLTYLLSDIGPIDLQKHVTYFLNIYFGGLGLDKYKCDYLIRKHLP